MWKFPTSPWKREGISSNHRSKANVFGDRPWTPSSSERWGSQALRWRRWWRPPSTPRECWDELDDFEGWAGKVTWEQRKVMSIRAWKYGECRNVYTISEDRDWLVVYLPPLKNMFVSWDDFPFPTVSGKSFKNPWFQSPPTSRCIIVRFVYWFLDPVISWTSDSMMSLEMGSIL